MLLKMVTSSTLRGHVSQVRKAAGAYQFGIYHEGGAREIAWKIHAKMAAEPSKVFIACDIKNGFGAARRRDAIDGARRWCPVLGTVFANLWAGKREVQPTAWANTPRGSRPITVRDGLLQGACEALVAFALALRVALAELDEEKRKQGSGGRLNWNSGRMSMTSRWRRRPSLHRSSRSEKRWRGTASNSGKTSAQHTAQRQKESKTSVRK